MQPPADPTDAERSDQDDIARLIDALMAIPAKARPSITVVGDEDVFAITPAKPPR